MKLGARRQNRKQPPPLLAKVQGLVVLALRVTINKKAEHTVCEAGKGKKPLPAAGTGTIKYYLIATKINQLKPNSWAYEIKSMGSRFLL